MEIIILTYFDIESKVLGFYVYQNNWKRVIGEVLKTCMEPKEEVDKYAVTVADNGNNFTSHLPKKESGKYAKTTP